MKTDKTVGALFVAGAIALFVPYTALTIIFDYPDVLRDDAGTVLIKFNQGGSRLIFTWFAFALTGVPLIPAYILLGQKLEDKYPLIRMASTIGVAGLILQMIGLLRWTFVVPVLADSFVSAEDVATKEAAAMAFKTIHQFAGVLLGEHLGQLFTIVWTVVVTRALSKLKMVSNWITWLGYISSFIYLLAQAELFHTVIGEFPFWNMAGFVGSTLWLLWVILIGIRFLRKPFDNELSSFFNR